MEVPGVVDRIDVNVRRPVTVASRNLSRSKLCLGESEGEVSALVDGRKQICRRDLECVGESNNHIECRITTRALYAADVCAVQSRMVCEFLLRGPSLGLSELANAITKGHAMSGDRCHISNTPFMWLISPRTMSHICASVTASASETRLRREQKELLWPI